MRKTTASGSFNAQPIIKFCGGKRQLLPELRKYVPERFTRYWEPFVGGGALFFDLPKPFTAHLSDTNERLIRMYRGVRDNVDDVVRRLKGYAFAPNTPRKKEFFEGMRRDDIDAKSDAEVAAWFIYLNKTAYNGMYRVNKANRFNVPFGRYENPTICDEENLRAVSERLADAVIESGDFEETTHEAGKGDFVYCDCPYVPLSASSNFTGYTQDGFAHADQVRLRDCAVALAKREAHVVLSNSSAPVVYELYKDVATIHEVNAKRSINSKADKRGAVKELILVMRGP